PSHLSPSLFPPLPRPTLFPYTTLFRSLDRDCPAGIRCTHCARRQNHEIAVLSHQYDIVSPMILDYEVDGPQHLRQQGGCLRLDPLSPVSSVGLVRLSAVTGEFGRSRLFC